MFCGSTTKSGRPDHREFEHCVCCQRPASRLRVAVEGKFDISTDGCRIANVRHPDAIVEMSVLTSVFVGWRGRAAHWWWHCNNLFSQVLPHVANTCIAAIRSAICVCCDVVVRLSQPRCVGALISHVPTDCAAYVVCTRRRVVFCATNNGIACCVAGQVSLR